MGINRAYSLLGLFQNYQTVTRTAGVDYVNDTGKPIVLGVAINGTSAACSTSVQVNGGPAYTFANAASGTGPSSAAGTIVIPRGATYRLADSDVSARSTYELR